MKRRPGTTCFRPARGLTLIEVVLAMGLLVLLSSLTYWFYASSLRTRDDDLKKSRRQQLSRVILDRMAQEFRQVVASSQYRAVGLRGESDRIWFLTVQVPSRRPYDRQPFKGDQTLLGEFDLAKIEYKIARHPDIEHDDGYLLPLGLARIEYTVPRQDSAETGAAFAEAGERPEEGSFFEEMSGEGESAEGEGQGEGTGEGIGEEDELGDFLEAEDWEVEDETLLDSDIYWEELYAPEIRYLRFCYFDGHSWWDDWDVTGENPLPQLIMITIGYEPHPPMGGEVEMEKEEEEFCTCMNEKDVELQECIPLEADQSSIVVRLTGADMFFRSRVAREAKAATAQEAVR